MILKILNKLKRDTLSTKFIPEVDGMRFFAIITVVLYHLNTAYAKSISINLSDAYVGLNDALFGIGWWVKRFDIGVKVFFAISGFILAIPFLKYYSGKGKKVHLKTYFLRRLTRLEPPYLISLFLFFLVHIFILNGSFNELFDSLLLGIFYLHTSVIGVPNPINPVTWSLETEAQFYIIIPAVIGIVFLIRRKAWIFGVLALFFVLSVLSKNYFLHLGNGHALYSILVYFVNFLVGILIAFLYVLNTPFFKKKLVLWDFVHLLSLFLMFYFYKPQAEIQNILLMNLGVFLFFISVFKSRVFNWFYTRQIVYVIGGMCYSIYLLHFAFFHLTVKYTSRLHFFNDYLDNFLVQMLINIPLMLVVSIIFFLKFEKPFMKKNWIKTLKSKN